MKNGGTYSGLADKNEWYLKENVSNVSNIQTEILFKMVLAKTLVHYLWKIAIYLAKALSITFCVTLILMVVKMNSFNAPTTQINSVDKMTTVKSKTVDLQGYVIIVVQTKDNKVKLYGKEFSFTYQIRSYQKNWRNFYYNNPSMTFTK